MASEHIRALPQTVKGKANLFGSDIGMLRGYAIVWDQFSVPIVDTQNNGQPYFEIVRKGATTETLKVGNLRLVYNHIGSWLLGRQKSNTLKVWEDSVGVGFEVRLPNTTIAHDILALIERGDIAGCSFRFGLNKGGERWFTKDGKTFRELTSIYLFELTITPTPAYPSTTVVVADTWPADKPADMTTEAWNNVQKVKQINKDIGKGEAVPTGADGLPLAKPAYMTPTEWANIERLRKVQKELKQGNK